MASPTREFTSTSLAFGSLLVKYNLDIWSTYYCCSCSLSHVSRGLERGTALPLLLDLDSKPVFLHDNSVPSLGALFDSSRGAASVLSVRHRSTHRRRHVPAQSRHQLTGERALLFLKGGSRLRDALSAAWFGERQDARDVYLN
jgi:hypothetical protein